MIYLICILASFSACLIGTICGMGGGIIIKPLLDATGVMSAGAITLLSGCTIICMSIWNAGRNIIKKQNVIEGKTSIMLGLGAAIGGVLGKQLYNMVKSLFENPGIASGVQAAVLFLATLLTLIYTIKKDKVKSLHVEGLLITLIIGFVLGTFSAFLGIGGGPFNVAVLYFFFSMEAKKAAQNSLIIVLFCQLFSVGKTVLFDGMPQFDMSLMILMIVVAIASTEIGRLLNKKISSKTATYCLEGAMLLVMAINAFNVYKFLL